jgi:hypothetical protein
MTAPTSAVVGGSPITFTGSTGAQRFVPLSALEFSGSTLQLASSWSGAFDSVETTTLLTLANSMLNEGELTAPPIPPPRPALVFTAVHTGPESNGIVVTVTPDSGPAATATIAISAVETDTYSGLTAADPAMTIGVDVPSGLPGAPGLGTGLVSVKEGTAVDTGLLPADGQTGTLTSHGTFDVKDTNSALIFTLVPRADYDGAGGLSVTVSVDTTANTFSVVASYDSSKEAGKQAKVTTLTLDTLPSQVAYLVATSAPPSGAGVPATTTVPLSGGGVGKAAAGIAYTG